LLKERGVKKVRMAKSKKNKNKPKLNLTVREEQRNKLEQMASLENRSVSNLIEVMANERWERLVEQQGVAYAKTVADAMKLKLDMDKPADREKLRRAILDLVAGRKNRKRGGGAHKENHHNCCAGAGRDLGGARSDRRQSASARGAFQDEADRCRADDAEND